MRRYRESLDVFTALTGFLEAKLAQAALLAPAAALAAGADVNQETIVQGEASASLRHANGLDANGGDRPDSGHAAQGGQPLHALLQQSLTRTSRLGSDAERFDRLRRLSAARQGRAPLTPLVRALGIHPCSCGFAADGATPIAIQRLGRSDLHTRSNWHSVESCVRESSEIQYWLECMLDLGRQHACNVPACPKPSRNPVLL